MPNEGKRYMTLKETKKNTGVDLLSIAVNNNNGDDQLKKDQNMKKEEEKATADTDVTTTARNNKNMPLQKTEEDRCGAGGHPKSGLIRSETTLQHLDHRE